MPLTCSMQNIRVFFWLTKLLIHVCTLKSSSILRKKIKLFDPLLRLWTMELEVLIFESENQTFPIRFFFFLFLFKRYGRRGT